MMQHQYQTGCLRRLHSLGQVMEIGKGNEHGRKGERVYGVFIKMVDMIRVMRWI